MWKVSVCRNDLNLFSSLNCNICCSILGINTFLYKDILLNPLLVLIGLRTSFIFTRNILRSSSVSVFSELSMAAKPFLFHCFLYFFPPQFLVIGTNFLISAWSHIAQALTPTFVALDFSVMPIERKLTGKQRMKACYSNNKKLCLWQLNILWLKNSAGLSVNNFIK